MSAVDKFELSSPIKIGDIVYHTSRMQYFKVWTFIQINGAKGFIPVDMTFGESLNMADYHYRLLICDCRKVIRHKL